MKKLLAIALCAGMTLSMTACGGRTADENAAAQNTATDSNTTITTESTEEPLIGGDPATWGPALDTETDEGENTQIPNPFITCSTLKEASELAGFDFTAPESVDGYSYKEISAIENEMAQITYFNSDELDGLTDEQLNEIDWEKVDFSAQDLVIRKAKGDEDISGDYNEYPEIYNVTVDDREVTMKGSDGDVNVAIWNEDGYSYAITASDAVTSDYVMNLIHNID